MKSSMTKYKFSDWMKKYRPDGVGRCFIQGLDDGMNPAGIPELVSEFTEVICDYCNAEITPKDDEGNESFVWSDDNYSICKSCAEE